MGKKSHIKETFPQNQGNSRPGTYPGRQLKQDTPAFKDREAGRQGVPQSEGNLALMDPHEVLLALFSPSSL